MLPRRAQRQPKLGVPFFTKSAVPLGDGASPRKVGADRAATGALVRGDGEEAPGPRPTFKQAIGVGDAGVLQGFTNDRLRGLAAAVAEAIWAAPRTGEVKPPVDGRRGVEAGGGEPQRSCIGANVTLPFVAHSFAAPDDRGGVAAFLGGTFAMVGGVAARGMDVRDESTSFAPDALNSCVDKRFATAGGVAARGVDAAVDAVAFDTHLLGDSMASPTCWAKVFTVGASNRDMAGISGRLLVAACDAIDV
mmetsp:Transcript_143285/g.457849  ORF Transcript_143285/g.457849 Transcript_143285/m.457849 type:complete len:249 (+) Transcript_143285:326-1072(+)